MNLEPKENMYIRTKDGIIAKVDYIDDDTIFFDKEIYKNCSDGIDFLEKDELERIIKASYNIIDLIEVGDYVNGYKVEEVNNNLNEHNGTCNSLDTYLWVVNDLDEFEEIVMFENDIKSVITHEQMEQMSYKVGD